jgi:hypothetical protein
MDLGTIRQTDPAGCRVKFATAAVVRNLLLGLAPSEASEPSVNPRAGRANEL